MPLFEASYVYAVSINKLAKVNNVANPLSFMFKSGETYNLMPSAILTGSADPNINNFTITLNEDKISNFTLE